MAKASRTERIPCPPEVATLVDRFGDHIEAYKSGAYNETQVRREFIDPMFTALGWDVDNRQGHAEAYKDVIHEDAIKVGGSTKAPDYCFRIGGVRKFFVEAKKPSRSVKDDPGPAYQLRRYAWTNKLPLSIVTDFEEFAVYDCRIKPSPDDKPSTARVLYVTYDEYADQWGDIASIFAKDAILKGSFDKYAESNKRKRGTAEVDAAFLQEIEEWRDQLARNIALRNPGIGVRNLNYAVGKIIDRIIFLRMCEDRGVETYAQLRTLRNGVSVYPRMVELFRRADERYNSGLFHFEPERDRAEDPDTLTPSLSIDDKVLKDIITRLYYPDCPYEFSVMPAEILGQVYEQFLGKVIRLTKGHRAVVEEKPEVRKAGGVYYTPKYIVDYIVEHTVGKLLEGKTPADVGPLLDQRKRNRDRKGAASSSTLAGAVASPLVGGAAGSTLRILDPACGSGSYLLGAYQYLLDWHLRWYLDNDPENWARKPNPPIYQFGVSQQGRARKEAPSDPSRARKEAVGLSHDSGGPPLPHGRGSERVGAYRLTVAERKRILLNNIFGVDIDSQAVEVTKLSLLLRVLEGESKQTLDNQLKLFHAERALPDLGSNIKCGNSLIGPDFYDNQQLDLFDEEERYRINAFDWNAEFPAVFSPSPSGGGPGREPTGFDAVIGNPPYGIVFDTEAKLYIERHYSTFQRNNDIYVCFLERCLSLLRSDRCLGFITPNTFLLGPYFDVLKRHILASSQVTRIVDFGTELVFLRVNVFTALLFLTRKIGVHQPPLAKCDYSLVNDLGSFPMTAHHSDLDADILATLRWTPQAALQRCFAETQTTLGEIAWIKDVGINYWTRGRGKKRGGSIADRVLYTGKRRHAHDRQYLKGRDIDRFSVECGPQWLAHDYESKLDAAVDTLRFSSQYLDCKKIVYRQTADRIIAAFDTYSLLTDKTVHVIVPKTGSEPEARTEFLLGLLNSRLLTFLYRSLAREEGRAFAQVKTFRIKELPIPTVDLDNAFEKRRHDRLVQLVTRMLDLHKQLGSAKTPTDKTAIQRDIDATDRRIDHLVYELYGLTDDEIRIVEEATA